MDHQDLENKVSTESGVDSFNNYEICTDDLYCFADNVCAKRRGASTGYCMPKWFGLCHAWSMASIYKVEPKCNITMNGVDFSINDVKGLLTQIYDNKERETLFIGNRCEEFYVGVSDFQRARNAECRDTHPEVFHLILTNLLGREKQSFIVDIDTAEQVWNHPDHSYSYTYEMVNAEKAANLISFLLDGKYVFNPKAFAFAHVKTNFQYVVEAFDYTTALTTNSKLLSRFLKYKNYEYILELDENGQIIGGEWIGDSKLNHPDFMWMLISKPNNNTSVAGIEYSFVNQLLEKATKGCE